MHHPKLYMDMHNIFSTHDVIRVCVKNQHATCNASIAKMFKNMPYLEAGKLLIELAIINPKVFYSNNTRL
jgi:hypothetical protein